ncbi:MAG: hypothetical protein QF693_06100 [Pelagibacteraceae bacterium]|nr:hypothetical protein [Pelagibacteraceae bacterium]
MTLTEIQSAAAGNIIYNKNLVIAYDFNEGIVDKEIKDLSTYGHHANVWSMKPIKKVRYESTSPELYTKCYAYSSSSWKFTIIVIIIIIVVLAICSGIYYWYWRTKHKVKPQQKK